MPWLLSDECMISTEKVVRGKGEALARAYCLTPVEKCPKKRNRSILGRRCFGWS
jgi:hypothetical protein